MSDREVPAGRARMILGALVLAAALAGIWIGAALYAAWSAVPPG